MSDRKNKMIEDRGWANMESILDKEMPTEKRRRRFGFWFKLGGGTLLFLGLIGLFYFAGIQKDSNTSLSETTLTEDYKYSPAKEVNTEPREISNPNNVKETAHKESTEALADNKETKNNATQTLFTEKHPANTISTLAQPIATPESDYVQTLIDSPMESEVASSAASPNSDEDLSKMLMGSLKDPLNITSPELSEDFKPNTQTKDIQPAIESHLTPNSEKKSERSHLDFLSPLPLIQSERLNTANRFALQPQPIIAFSKLQNSFSPYLIAGVSYQPNVKALGYGIGAGLNYGNSSFSGYFEAEYIRTKYNVGKLSNDFAANADLEEIVTISSNASGSFDLEENNIPPEYDLSVSNFVDLTTSMQEVRLSLGVRKRLLGGLSMDAGISFAKLISVSNKALLVTPLGFTGVFEDMNSSFNIKSSELYSSGAYSQYDISPNVGLEYSFGEHFHLGFKYHYGLRNLINRTDVERINSLSTPGDAIYRRNASVKMRYLF